MSAVRFTLAARKGLLGFPAGVRSEAENQLKALADNWGDASPIDAGGSRLKIGQYRLMLRRSADTLEVVRAGHRKDIYS